MSNNVIAYTLALCLLSSSLAHGQTPSSKPVTSSKKNTTATTSKPAKASAADTRTEEQRTVAISLLTVLADEAHKFQDLNLRARVQAKVADALWKTDADRARQLFRRAWDDAVAVENDEKSQAEEKRTPAKGSTRTSTKLRAEILRLAAVRDRKLAEEFLTKLSDEVKQQTSDASNNGAPSNSSDPLELSPIEAKRLDLANDLLKSSELESAVQIAGPVLNRTTEQTVLFLSLLRAKNPTAADNLYLALLGRAMAEPTADAVTVSLLSSYIFSPQFFVTVTHEGFTNTSQYGKSAPPSDLPQNVRAAFFRAAASILLRPILPPDQDQTVAGRPGAYFTITRLLPLFERYAPDYVPDLQARRIALSTPQIAQVFNPKTNEHLNEGLTSTNRATSERQDQIDVNSLTDASARDRIYAEKARMAAMKDDDHARDFADKIEDTELRQQVRADIDFILVRQAVNRKETEEVLRLTTSGNLTHPQRAWALTEAARLFKNSSPDRASSLLNEAAIEARRIEETDPDRVHALIAVAAQLHDIDKARTWEIMTEVVKAANKCKDFAGEDVQINVSMHVGEAILQRKFTMPSFNLAAIFNLLAKDDLNLAISMARDFAAEAPRSLALISIANSVLNGEA
jgi:hypothetical protein